MNVLVYISKGVSDVDRQYLTTLFALLDTNPDIEITYDAPLWRHNFSLFHIFGCWDAKALRLYNIALRTHTPVVLSPFGELNPWRIHNLLKVKRMLLNIPVQRMLSRVEVVHACGQFESDTLKSLNATANIVRIDNPRISGAIDTADMAAQFVRLYHKTLNTWPATMLTAADLELVGALVLAGIDAEMFAAMDLRLETIDALTTPQWRYVLMYAAQERVLDLVRKGLERLQTETPSTDLSKFETFCFDPIPEDDNLAEGEEQEAEDEQQEETDNPDDNSTVDGIVEIVRTLYDTLPKDTAHLQLLATLYANLRLTDYDEQALVQALNKVKLLPFFRRVESVMHHLFKLPEGFMPILPLDDKQTKSLTNKITKVYN